MTLRCFTNASPPAHQLEGIFVLVTAAREQQRQDVFHASEDSTQKTSSLAIAEVIIICGAGRDEGLRGLNGNYKRVRAGY